MQVQKAIDNLNRMAAEDHQRMDKGDFFTDKTKIRELITQLIPVFKETDLTTRTAISTGLTRYAKDQLLGYAGNMAVLAVREESTSRIHDGLTAMAIEDGGGSDWRDSLVVVALLYNSSVKLGMDATAAFEQASSLLPETDFQKAIKSFPSRRDRDLECWGRREVMTKDGFNYR